MADVSVSRKRQRGQTPTPPELDIAPASLFYPLTLHIVTEAPSDIGSDDTGPAADTSNDDAEPPTPSSSPSPVSIPTESESSIPTTYELSVSRIDGLQSHLTASMALDLKSLLAVIQTHLAPPPPAEHPLITHIASPTTEDETLVALAKTIGSGLRAFLARGGPRTAETLPPDMPPTPAEDPPNDTRAKTPSSTRSRIVKSHCSKRDDRTCRLTGQRAEGLVAHVIPYSVREKTAVDFWKFIALFRGEQETAALRTAALGSGNTTDTLRNVWWLCAAAHTAFDAGQVCVIPQLEPSQVPYDPSVVAEYRALVEFPAGLGELSLPIVTYRRRGGHAQFGGFLSPGATIVFRTTDPSVLPLPHPLLFQLHAVCSRILAMKAAAGWQRERYYDGEDDEGSSMGEEFEMEVDDEPYWPPVPGSVASHAPSSAGRVEKPLFVPVGHDAQTEVSASEEEQHEKARWPSVVRGEHDERMEEMWRLCGERLGRDIKGGRWWV